MYKNFSLTDKERKQILEMHQSKGYKKPMNEDLDDDVENPVQDEPSQESSQEVWVLKLPYNDGRNTHVHVFSTEEKGKQFMEENNITLWKNAGFYKTKIK